MISEERQNTLSLDLCVPILSDSFDILLKICGEPVAESPNASTLPPPIVASLALQHPPVVELPVTQQLPCIQLNTQPPSVENSPTTQQGVALLVSTVLRSTPKPNKPSACCHGCTINRESRNTTGPVVRVWLIVPRSC